MTRLEFTSAMHFTALLEIQNISM